jgi:hypothetical protein
MQTLPKFEHQGTHVWCGELYGRDICVSRELGKDDFLVWVDSRQIGNSRTLYDAHKLAERFCLLT